MNGYQDPVRRSVDRVVDDWFSLLNHDHLVTATGNSDSHHLTFNIGGYPRNYVKVRDNKPGARRTRGRSPTRFASTMPSSPPARSCACW